MLGRSEISSEVSADPAVLRWQRGRCERPVRQCWQPMQCLSGAEPVGAGGTPRAGLWNGPGWGTETAT